MNVFRNAIFANMFGVKYLRGSQGGGGDRPHPRHDRSLVTADPRWEHLLSPILFYSIALNFLPENHIKVHLTSLMEQFYPKPFSL